MDWRTEATWEREEEAERAVYASRYLDMEGRGVAKMSRN